jgi:hypothetical protein
MHPKTGGMKPGRGCRQKSAATGDLKGPAADDLVIREKIEAVDAVAPSGYAAEKLTIFRKKALSLLYFEALARNKSPLFRPKNAKPDNRNSCLRRAGK